MYSETKKPGTKQFFSGLLMMLAVYTLGCILNAALKSLPLLRAALIFIMCCGAVYLAYVRCGVQYTYSLGKKGERHIGRSLHSGHPGRGVPTM